MSGTAFNSQPGNKARETVPHQHRLHNPNEPLPGSYPAQQQYEVRYSDENLSVWSRDSTDSACVGPECFQFRASLGCSTYVGRWVSDLLGNSVAGSERSPVGGVARGGRADVPIGEASLLDNVIGKTEKV